MAWLDQPLRGGASPLGIVSLELARTPERARAIVSGWNELARVHAAFALGLDFLFLVSYATLFRLSCRRVSFALREQGSTRWAAAGALLGALQPIAAACDACENAGIFCALRDVFDPSVVLAVWLLALAKFALSGIGVGYVVLGLVVLLFARLRSRSPA